MVLDHVVLENVCGDCLDGPRGCGKTQLESERHHFLVWTLGNVRERELGTKHACMHLWAPDCNVP